LHRAVYFKFNRMPKQQGFMNQLDFAWNLKIYIHVLLD
jgi:hypothetical protein